MKKAQVNWLLLFIASLVILVVALVIVMKYSHRGNELLDYLRGL